MHISKSAMDSPNSRLAIFGTGWDGTPTGQSLLSVTSAVVREKLSPANQRWNILLGDSITIHVLCLLKCFIKVALSWNNSDQLPFSLIACTACPSPRAASFPLSGIMEKKYHHLIVHST
jgi:hypothetical protein